jgi:DNA-directed RNA polymerase specialized sigma24 family protein
LTKSSTETSREFQRFLSWLDDGVDSGGERYVEMRRRLVSYCGRKRCLSPDDLADEALNRVARKLEEQGSITDSPPARYCYIVARFVFLEYVRGADHRRTSLDEPRSVAKPAVQPTPVEGASRAADEALLDGLDRCLQRLSAYDRALILEYYAGDEQERIAGRRALAARLRLTLNALSIRACRIRDTLEGCLNAQPSGT